MAEPKLRLLAERFGAERVWTVGEKVLGWPPTWQPSHNDVLTILEVLEKGP